MRLSFTVYNMVTKQSLITENNEYQTKRIEICVHTCIAASSSYSLGL